MNCQQANEINIVDYLSKLGIQPTTTKGRNFWYCSPIREEKTPSFKVDPEKNMFYDFGTGTNGRLVDLVCQLHMVSVTGALLILSGAAIKPHILSLPKQKEETLPEPTLEIKRIQPLQNKALIQYIESRGISEAIATRYVEEAYYAITIPETGEIKKYFALAFRNDLGAFELRNKYFKGGNSPKGITTIPGNLNKVNIFEGWLDFLSCVVYYRQPSPANTTIVLNSVSHLRKINDLLPNFEHINLWLDNDQAGVKAANEIIGRFPDAVNQAAKLYPKFKDMNEFLTSGNCR